MKEFFLDTLNNLYTLAGLKQLENIVSSGNDPKIEINNLMNALCKVSEMFPEIPDADQQKIISAGVISDPEFKGLNARIIYKWLAPHRERYLSKTMDRKHPEVDPEGRDMTPLTGEARAKRIQEYLDALAPFEEKVDPDQRKEFKRQLVFGVPSQLNQPPQQ